MVVATASQSIAIRPRRWLAEQERPISGSGQRRRNRHLLGGESNRRGCARRPGAARLGAVSINCTICGAGAVDGIVTTAQRIINGIANEAMSTMIHPVMWARGSRAAHEPQTEPHGRPEQQRPQRQFQKQRQHHFFPPFVCVILSVSMRSRLRSSIAKSTMPTRTSSIEPLQNQSTTRCTALAATRSRGSVAR